MYGSILGVFDKAMNSLMTPDELGEKGESRFKEICADIGLICNKSDRDRSGWDFIVEFPFKNKENVTLDYRPTPLSCHVQVKTVFESTKRFQMRLSSAERLAKELKPAFVYVFKVNKAKQITESFLVHLLDDRLVTILKRLRQEEAIGTPSNKINKKTISLTLNNTERVESTGAALRAALESACGDDIHLYAIKKKEQLEKLGFESYKGKFTLHLASTDEIVDVFLGLKKEIQISNFQTTQERFGIKLPQFSSPEGKLSIQPHSVDQCSITISHDELSHPAAFIGDMFFPGLPGLPPEKLKAYIKSELFSLIIKPNGYNITYDIGSPKRQPPEIWLHFWRMMYALSSGEGTIRITPKKLPGEILLPITPTTTNSSKEDCKSWIKICEDASYLFKQAGVVPEPEITLVDLETNFEEISFVNSLFKKESLVLSFKTQNNSVIEKMRPEIIIFPKLLHFETISLAYYAIAQFSTEIKGDQIYWRSIKFLPGYIRNIKNNSDSYDEFINNAQKVENVSYVIRLDPKNG